MTQAERVVSLLADEIRRLQIELAIAKAELDIVQESTRADPGPNTDTDQGAAEASFLLEEKHD